MKSRGCILCSARTTRQVPCNVEHSNHLQPPELDCMMQGGSGTVGLAGDSLTLDNAAGALQCWPSRLQLTRLLHLQSSAQSSRQSYSTRPSAHSRCGLCCLCCGAHQPLSPAGCPQQAGMASSLLVLQFSTASCCWNAAMAICGRLPACTGCQGSGASTACRGPTSMPLNNCQPSCADTWFSTFCPA